MDLWATEYVKIAASAAASLPKGWTGPVKKRMDGNLLPVVMKKTGPVYEGKMPPRPFDGNSRPIKAERMHNDFHHEEG